MSDARTKLDILYRDVVGDVADLLDKVEALNKSLPFVAGEIDAKLLPLREELAALVGRISVDAEKLVQNSRNDILRTGQSQQIELKEYANKLLEKQAEKASEVVNSAVSLAVARSIEQPIRGAVDEVIAVAKGLDTATYEVNQAASAVSWEWWKRGLYLLGASIIGGLIALSIAKVAGMMPSQSQLNELLEIERSNSALLQEIAPSKAALRK